MKEFWLKYWWIVVIVVAVIILVIVLYFTIYKAGTAAGVTAVLASIPNPAIGGDYTTQESMAIRAYTTWLDDEFHVYTFHNRTQWAALAQEKDRVLIGVSNQYALDFATPGISTSGTGNLYNDIQSTYFATTFEPENVATRLKTLLGL